MIFVIASTLQAVIIILCIKLFEKNVHDKVQEETPFDNIKIGNWYFLDEYGHDYMIRAKIVGKSNGQVYAKFYWGAPFRTVQKLEHTKVLGKTKKPLLPFSNGKL